MQVMCQKKSLKTGKVVDKWPATVRYCKKLGNDCYEIYISSRSTILLTLVNTSRGWVASIPDWRAGCFLSSDLCDVFYNMDRLEDSMRNQIDAITVAYVLAAVGKSLDSE